MKYHDDRVAVATDEHESSDEEDEEDTEGFCALSVAKWRIVPNGSVYDAGMVHILTICNKPACMKTLYMILSIFSLVCLNAYLQLTFTARIWTMLKKQEDDTAGNIFASVGGACAYQPASSYTNSEFDLKKAGTEPNNWDCGPLFPVLFSNVSWLDVNGDGYWSEKDNFDATAQKLLKMFPQSGLVEQPHLRHAFDGFMEDIREELFLSQLSYKNQLGKSDKPMEDIWAQHKYTHNFSQIPMEWMRAEQPSINLCNNVEIRLCGNLEVRGILNYTIDAQIKAKHGHSNAWSRVAKCRRHVDRCVRKFGETFRAYTFTQRAACGDKDSTLDPKSSVLITRYTNPDNYDPETNPDAIGTMNYMTFLLLILTVWGLAMLDELRQVNSWWWVLALIPCNGTVVDEDDDTIEVKSISCFNKFIIIVLVLLPRTIVVLLMSYIGTMFLIETDDYSELILNAVGMGFLMEMDEMLFNGLASDHDKDNMDKLANIEGEHSVQKWVFDISHYALPAVLVIVVLLAVLFPEYDAFNSKEGKIAMTDALNCMCHMEGKDCVAAQILGGLVRVPRDLFD